MKTILLNLILVGAMFAQLPTKLQVLQQKRDAAIENINQIYKQELQKLLLDPTVKGDPIKLSEVLKELGVEPPITIPSITTIKIEERFFARKTWRNQRGTRYEFSPNGTGVKKYGSDIIPLSWKIIDNNNILEITSKDLLNGPDKIWYIRLMDKTHGLTGTDPDNLEVGISLIEEK